MIIWVNDDDLIDWLIDYLMIHWQVICDYSSESLIVWWLFDWLFDDYFSKSLIIWCLFDAYLMIILIIWLRLLLAISMHWSLSVASG